MRKSRLKSSRFSPVDVAGEFSTPVMRLKPAHWLLVVMMGLLWFALVSVAMADSYGCVTEDETDLTIAQFPNSPQVCATTAGAACTAPEVPTTGRTQNIVNADGDTIPIPLAYYNAQFATASVAASQSAPNAIRQVLPMEKFVCRSHAFAYNTTVADANGFCSLYPVYKLTAQQCTATQNQLIDQAVNILGFVLIGAMAMHGFATGARR